MRLRVLLLSVMPVARIEILTVTVHVAVRFVPSAVVAVMVAVPLLTAVTTPSLLTVATPVSLLVHVTLVLLTLDGVTVAVSVAVSPAAAKLRLVLLSEMPVALMSTVTVHVAVRFVPSAVVAVMVAVPLPTAVTTPSLLTVATPMSLLVHVTLVLLALDGVTVAVRVAVWPDASNDRLVLLSEMPVALISTVTVH